MPINNAKAESAIMSLLVFEDHCSSATVSLTSNKLTAFMIYLISFFAIPAAKY